MKNTSRDVGLGFKLAMATGATAAMGMTRRLGIGRTRHVDTSMRWIQSTNRNCDIELEKVLGELNPSDALTKHATAREIKEHMDRLGMIVEEGRPAAAPQLVQNP